LCHNIAVALDQDKKSPLHQRIKRLGVATEGRFNETITQATLVESLIVYISKDPVKDRDVYVRGGTPAKAGANESQRFIFRNMMIEDRDLQIVDVMWNYFDAVKLRWPAAWDNMGRGSMLNKTNGFRAFMRFLRPAYLNFVRPGGVPKREHFSQLFDRIPMRDDAFTIETFVPGTSGEVTLYNRLRQESGI
jgi:DGQHR domain-containing protein